MTAPCLRWRNRCSMAPRVAGNKVIVGVAGGEFTPHRGFFSAFDVDSGRELWRCEQDVFGTWLSYSEQQDVLVEAGRRTRDILFDEPKGMRAYSEALIACDATVIQPSV